ncbi:hypothetical protein ACJ73_05777 [Blastomyces percursus]|uniref:Uncharacterized protein n=1 Tax=Blastomyces percursus TaxID=1658174 RepID=A0A1J9Q2V4_9EURO|nr:hypothetical protein ACJ73_05777 [Blastomyces percursus]
MLGDTVYCTEYTYFDLRGQGFWIEPGAVGILTVPRGYDLLNAESVVGAVQSNELEWNLMVNRSVDGEDPVDCSSLSISLVDLVGGAKVGSRNSSTTPANSLCSSPLGVNGKRQKKEHCRQPEAALRTFSALL